MLNYHRHKSFEIFWIISGSAIHYNDFETHAVSAGSLVFVNQGQVHAWRFSAGTHGCLIAFSPALFASRQTMPGEIAGLPYFNPVTLNPVISVPQADRPFVDHLCARLLYEYTNSLPNRSHGLRSLLESLLIQCDRLGTHREKVRDRGAARRLTQAFTALVELHFAQKHQVQDYAALLQVSMHTLTRSVRATTGRSPLDLINDRILLEARRHLWHSTQTVGEIAYRLGFRTPSNFGRFFMRHAKCSPGAVRRRSG